jgi:hypothetical protein
MERSQHYLLEQHAKDRALRVNGLAPDQGVRTDQQMIPVVPQGAEASSDQQSRPEVRYGQAGVIETRASVASEVYPGAEAVAAQIRVLKTRISAPFMRPNRKYRNT